MNIGEYIPTAVHPVRRRYDSEHADPVQSEISMSVVTDDTRLFGYRRRSTFNALNGPRSRICCSINVEPILFFTACCLGLSLTNSSLFTYWARCIQIAESATHSISNSTYSCALISTSNSTLQDEVESDIANTKIYIQICGSIPTLIISPIIGSWSDRNGRKAPLLFSLFGLFLSSFLQLCATLTYSTINVYYWFFSSDILLGLFGGGAATFANSLAIVTDDSRNQLRPGSSTVPFRVGIATFIQSIGTILGTLISSFLSVPALVDIERHSLSYVKCAFIVSALSLISLIYAVFFVRETHFPNRQDFSYNQFNNIEEIIFENEVTPPPTRKPFTQRWSDYFKSIFGVVFVARPGWTRLCLCMSLFFVFVEFLSFDPSLLLLLVKRKPFSWNDRLFSNFSVVRGVVTSLGMVLGPLLLNFSNCLGKDSLIIIAGLASSAAASFLTAFATQTQHIFYTCIFGLIIGGMLPSYRSFLPRMVGKDETARLLTVVSILIAFSPILSSLIFNSIFEATMDWWAGFAFFVSGIFQAIVFIGQLVIHLLMRPQWKMEKELQEMHNEQFGSKDDFDRPAENEQRSVSNTAVDSDSGSQREIL